MITSSQISSYRKKIKEILKNIEKLSFKSLYTDFLIHGIPGEVYRTCGKRNCRCFQNKDQRHGPYKVIQIPVNGGKKQISVPKKNEHLWTKAKNYQYQIRKLAELRARCLELGNTIDEIISKRVQEYPTDDK